MPVGEAYSGLESYLYINSATHASPTWAELVYITGVKLPMSKGEIELADKSSEWKKFLAGLKEIGLSFTYNKRRGATDAVFDLLLDSFLANTPREFASLDGPVATAGSYGFKAAFQVFKFDKSEELEGVVSYDVELKLTELVESGAVIEPDEFTVAGP